MKRYLWIACSVVFVALIALPCQVWATSITPTKAAIGEGCIASGGCSTAMGVNTRASGYGSIAMGSSTTSGGHSSLAGGKFMQLTADADHTFVWGYSDTPQSITTPDAFLIFPGGTAGRVGIGTPNPGTKRHIKGNGWPESFVFLDTHGENQDAGIRFYENATVKGHLYHDANADALRFFYHGANQLALHSNGNACIGTTTPDYPLEVVGNAAKTSGGTTWINSSDERLKDVTGEYQRGFDAIASLRPVTFFYKQDNPRGLPSNEENIGFIAQEV